MADAPKDDPFWDDIKSKMPEVLDALFSKMEPEVGPLFYDQAMRLRLCPPEAMRVVADAGAISAAISLKRVADAAVQGEGKR